MNPKAKKFLSNFFFGLFSNDHAIEGSKSNPWWVCLIIGLFAAILPVLPITVSNSKAKGDDFLKNYTYRFDRNIATLSVNMSNDGKEFKINEEHLLEYYVNDVKTELDDTADKNPVGIYKSNRDGVEQYELMIYYTARPKKALSDYIKNIDATVYKVGTTEVVASDSEDSKYAPSYIVLAKEGIYTRINQEDSTNVGNGTYTAYAADWKEFKAGHELLKNVMPKNEGTKTPKSAVEVDLKDQAQRTEIFNNWKEIYRKSFISQRNYNVLMSSLVFLGVYIILIFIMGLLVFLLTRGKTNMFNYLKFMDCQKMVWWAALAPALLALIFGFIFSNFAQMIFIILIGLRVMWMSMKQLRPQ